MCNVLILRQKWPYLVVFEEYRTSGMGRIWICLEKVGILFRVGQNFFIVSVFPFWFLVAEKLQHSPTYDTM